MTTSRLNSLDRRSGMRNRERRRQHQHKYNQVCHFSSCEIVFPENVPIRKAQISIRNAAIPAIKLIASGEARKTTHDRRGLPMDANNWADQDYRGRFSRDARAGLNLRPVLKLSSLPAT